MTTYLTSPRECMDAIPATNSGARLQCITQTTEGKAYAYTADMGEWLKPFIDSPVMWVAVTVLLVFLVYAAFVAMNGALTGRQKWGWILTGLFALPLAIGLYLALSPAPSKEESRNAEHAPA